MCRAIHQAPLDSLAEAAQPYAMRRKEPWPVPMAQLWADPRYRALPCAAVGMLARLCEHFWLTECRRFPRDDDTLMGLARAHRPTWRRYRTEILSIFDAWAPVAARYFRTRQRRHASLSIAGKCSAAVRRRKAAMVAFDGSRNLTPPARSWPLREAAQSYGAPNGPTPSGGRLWTD